MDHFRRSMAIHPSLKPLIFTKPITLANEKGIETASKGSFLGLDGDLSRQRVSGKAEGEDYTNCSSEGYLGG